MARISVLAHPEQHGSHVLPPRRWRPRLQCASVGKQEHIRLRSRSAYALIAWGDHRRPKWFGRHGRIGAPIRRTDLQHGTAERGCGRDWTHFRRNISELNYGEYGSLSVLVRRGAKLSFHQCLRWLFTIAA